MFVDGVTEADAPTGDGLLASIWPNEEWSRCMENVTGYTHMAEESTWYARAQSANKRMVRLDKNAHPRGLRQQSHKLELDRRMGAAHHSTRIKRRRGGDGDHF